MEHGGSTKGPVLSSRGFPGAGTHAHPSTHTDSHTQAHINSHAHLPTFHTCAHLTHPLIPRTYQHTLPRVHTCTNTRTHAPMLSGADWGLRNQAVRLPAPSPSSFLPSPWARQMIPEPAGSRSGSRSASVWSRPRCWASPTLLPLTKWAPSRNPPPGCVESEHGGCLGATGEPRGL